MRVLSTDSALTLRPDPARGSGLASGFILGPWHVKPQEGCIEADGHQRHLGPRQMDLLLFLAQHPDQVVSKDSLFQAVWRDVAVEDGALARCISELRRLLGDDARNPSFIATLPRRGYRLMAPVKMLDATAPAPTQKPKSTSEIEADPASETQAVSLAIPEPPSWRWKATYTLASILLATLLASFQHQPPPPSMGVTSPDSPADRFPSTLRSASALNPKKVAVLGFENLSDRQEDDWLSSALGELLTAELAASHGLHVLPPSTVAERERRLLTGANRISSEASRRHLQHDLGTEWLVFGTYLSLGESDGPLRLDVWIERHDPGAPPVVISETSQGEDLLRLIQRVGTRLRQELRLGDPALPLVHHSEGNHLYTEGSQCPEPQMPRPS